MNITWDQVRGVSERILLVGGTWAVSKGYITQDQLVTTIIPLLLALIGVVWATYNNSPKSLAQRTVASTPNTTIVTTAAIANNTPELNIVSSADNTVIPKP